MSGKNVTLQASRLASVFTDFIMGKGGFKINEKTREALALERAITNWNAIVLEIKGADTITLENDLDKSIKFSRHIYNGLD